MIRNNTNTITTSLVVIVNMNTDMDTNKGQGFNQISFPLPPLPCASLLLGCHSAASFSRLASMVVVLLSRINTYRCHDGNFILLGGGGGDGKCKLRGVGLPGEGADRGGCGGGNKFFT